MAVGTLKSNAIGISPIGSISGGLGTVGMLEGRESSSQTFIKGAPLKLSSGLLIEATADDVADFVGIAAEPASTVTDTLIKYWPVGVDTIWSATFEDQTNEDHALLIGDVGLDYALQTDTPGNWYVDQNDTTAVAVTMIGPVEWEDVTNATVRARVKIRFLVLALDTTP